MEKIVLLVLLVNIAVYVILGVVLRAIEYYYTPTKKNMCIRKGITYIYGGLICGITTMLLSYCGIACSVIFVMALTTGIMAMLLRDVE